MEGLFQPVGDLCWKGRRGRHALPFGGRGGVREKQRLGGGRRPRRVLQKPRWEAHGFLPNSEGMCGPAEGGGSRYSPPPQGPLSSVRPC